MNRSTRFILSVSAILLLVAAFLMFMQKSPDGGTLFRTEGCINCHSFKGQGGGIGPDLTSVTKTRSDKWIRDQIISPHMKDSRMPSFRHLTRVQINAIIQYLKS